MFSNIGGTATAVGDPPNVIIVSSKWSEVVVPYNEEGEADYDPSNVRVIPWFLCGLFGGFREGCFGPLSRTFLRPMALSHALGRYQAGGVNVRVQISLY